MKDLVPLRNAEADTVERSLLEAGAREVPSSRLRAKLWSALGAGTSAALVTKAAEGIGATAAPSAAHGSAVGAAGGVTAVTVGKWAGLALVVGGMA